MRGTREATMTDDMQPDDMRTSTVEESAPKATMGEFSHSTPYTGQTFGDEMAFERGPVVAADGGCADAENGEDEEETMADVDHEHPHEEENDANRVFARGRHSNENRTDSV
jgi:hypothetical protein